VPTKMSAGFRPGPGFPDFPHDENEYREVAIGLNEAADVRWSYHSTGNGPANARASPRLPCLDHDLRR
jgi:hypothetical protein